MFKEFIKKHKVLLIIFGISIFLMIKNSSIPYFFNPPVFVAFIFDAPKSDLFSSIAAMVDIFTSAYVTSLLFYLMVDYAPSYKQEQISNKIITPKLVSLYSYISELLAMIEYSAKLQGLDRTEKNENFDELQFESSTIFCKKRSVINGADKGASVHFYNLLIDCDKYRNLILTTCKDIAGTPNFSNCDEEIVCIISEIQLSQMLQMLLKPDDPMLKIYRQIIAIFKNLNNRQKPQTNVSSRFEKHRRVPLR